MKDLHIAIYGGGEAAVEAAGMLSPKWTLFADSPPPRDVIVAVRSRTRGGEDVYMVGSLPTGRMLFKVANLHRTEAMIDPSSSWWAHLPD